MCPIAKLLPITADGTLCVFVYVAGEGALWEKLLATVRIDERKIRVLSGLGQACMDTILLCENFLLSLVIFPIITVVQRLPFPLRGTNLERTGESKNVVRTPYDLLGMWIFPTCMIKDAAAFSTMLTKCYNYISSPRRDLDFFTKIGV